jgi:hypothetical protein
LAERGIRVQEMNAGWKEWLQDELPVEQGAPQESSSARRTAGS